MGIKQTRGFPLHPNKKPRHPNAINGIILTHMVDLVSKNRQTQSDIIFDISDKNQYNEHFFYFRKNLGYEHYGYHFFFETYMNEIFPYVGCNFSNRSEYLEEITKAGILNPMYKDFLLVVINGNLSFDISEQTMYTKVAYYLSGIMNYEVMEEKKLKYMWDIIDHKKAETSDFLFAPMTHFDRDKLRREMMRFKNK